METQQIYQLLNNIIKTEQFKRATRNSKITILKNRSVEIYHSLHGTEYISRAFLAYFIVLLLEEDFIENNGTIIQDSIDVINFVAATHALIRPKIREANEDQRKAITAFINEHIVKWVHAHRVPHNSDVLAMIDRIVAR
jgi:uncharacterized Fe-S cluster-containing radical SAM superfamily protein